jgi:hypothetical protein
MKSMLRHRRFALLSCLMTVLASACTMSSRRPEQLVAPDDSVAAPHQESSGMSQSSGSGGATNHAPGHDAGATNGSGGAASAPEPMDDAGATKTPPPSPMHASNSDASVPHALDASTDAGQQPLPECAANFAIEVTACLLLDPTNADCPHLADHCGLIDASVDPAMTADGG